MAGAVLSSDVRGWVGFSPQRLHRLLRASLVAPLAGGNSRIGAVFAPTRQDVFARLEEKFLGERSDRTRRAKKFSGSGFAQKDLESLKEEASGVCSGEQKILYLARV
jgi:hypothetical protein